jgi:hypothetical protein
MVGKNWNDEDMHKALDLIKTGKSIAQAAKTFSIPWPTLKGRISCKYSDKNGRPTALSETEVILVDFYYSRIHTSEKVILILRSKHW